MPPKGGALDAEQIDIIKRWITEGAQPSKKFTAPREVFPPDEPVSFHNHIKPLFEKNA